MTRAKPEPKRVVSPRALVWARERAQLERADVAEQLRRKTVDASTIASWERGDAQPTPAQRRDLAGILRIPERWLFHKEPPTAFDDLGIVDFRTQDRRPLDTLSLNLRGAIEHALAVQAWVVDDRAHNDEDPVPLVAARMDRESPKQVAEYLRRALRVEQVRADAKDADAFFNGLRRRLEESGVLVLRMGQVANKTRWSLDPTEFKGFTLIDEDRLAPLIFINRKDLDDAQLFTLGHELAHLVTGGSGVSNEDIEDFDDDKPWIERFCDDVAEELLAPAEWFEQVWGAKRGLDEKRLNYVASELKVSPLVAGRRAVSLGRATPRAFHGFVAASIERTAATKKPSGGNPYQSYPAWYGRELVRLLTSAATTDHPSGSDALELLGVSYDVARTLGERVAEKKAGTKQEPKELPRMKPVALVKLHDGWRTERR